MLGDSEAQDQIRKRTPDKSHCKLLLKDSSFCTACPNNPHNDKARFEKIGIVHEFGSLIDDARQLRSMLRLGIVASTELSPEQVTAVTVYDEAIEFELVRLQADWVGVKVAEVVSKMFAGA